VRCSRAQSSVSTQRLRQEGTAACPDSTTRPSLLVIPSASPEPSARARSRIGGSASIVAVAMQHEQRRVWPIASRASSRGYWLTLHRDAVYSPSWRDDVRWRCRSARPVPAMPRRSARPRRVMKSMPRRAASSRIWVSSSTSAGADPGKLAVRCAALASRRSQSISDSRPQRERARAADSQSGVLENRRPGSPRSVGSNPAPSASGAQIGSTEAPCGDRCRRGRIRPGPPETAERERASLRFPQRPVGGRAVFLPSPRGATPQARSRRGGGRRPLP
jgi:hypothetical protein